MDVISLIIVISLFQGQRPASMKATITQIKTPSGQKLHVIIAYGVNTINVVVLLRLCIKDELLRTLSINQNQKQPWAHIHLSYNHSSISYSKYNKML